ncbi:MAG: tartrate-resistant acid phosphatase type 5 [Polaribacter sp.]|jgi:tartrate-resistant acid phosphatase type 5
MNQQQFMSFLLLFSFFTSCQKEEPELIAVPINATPPLSIEAESIDFAVIGDFGMEGDNALNVSNLVKSWDPDFVLTVGDNNYYDGEFSTIGKNIGQYYCDFIYNPDSPAEERCEGPATQSEQNRFFPSLGNHDQSSANDTRPYEAFFSLPGNEIFYDFEWGPVHFFALNSGQDTDHECCESEQAVWLRRKLTASTKTFKVVYFHHPPYSSGKHGSDEAMQWPFKEWGADAILSGHDHNYERINEKGNPDFVYFVNGLGGKSIRDCGVNSLDESRFDSFCYNEDYGAMYCTASAEELRFRFFEVGNNAHPVDEFVIYK